MHTIGFGKRKMAGSYAIVVNGVGNITERKLGHTRQGRLLKPSKLFAKLFDIEYNHLGLREVRVIRSLQSENEREHYSFDFMSKYNIPRVIKIPLIYAFGETTMLSYHGTHHRNITAMNLYPKYIESDF